MKNQWFEVDKNGLAKLLKRHKNRAFLVYELVQNAWDEASKNVEITFRHHIPSEMNSFPSPYATLVVHDDNPEGFKKLEHAYTLFAESEKKHDPTKRGRFNIGEKLILACCIQASILTTKGLIRFNEDGSRQEFSDDTTKEGSQFTALVEMDKSEFDEICKEVKRLIPPPEIKTTTFNGKELKKREPVTMFKATLPTEITDKEGNLKPTERMTQVDVYETVLKPTIYEMGIPVVEVDCKFDIDIQQKVPLNIDRTNITPAYLKRLRTLVLNETYNLLTKDEATEPWIQEASSNKDCSTEAITKVVDLKFGEKKVSFDMSDPEANKLAMSKGYTVVSGGSLSKGQWSNIREAEAMLPAGQVTPSPKPYSPDGEPLEIIPFEKWTKQMKRVVWFAQTLAQKTIEIEKRITVQITNDPGLHYKATFGPGGPLVLSKRHLGNRFFEEFPENIEEVISLLIHEFGHQYSSDHLSSEYHEALCQIGGRMAKLASDNLSLFKK